MDVLDITAPDTGTRQCIGCGNFVTQDKPNWPYQAGKPVGRFCRPCARVQHKLRKEKYAAAKKAGLATLMPDTLPNGKPVQKTGAAVVPLKPNQLDVAKALRAGATTLNQNAFELIERALSYAQDASSPHHEWAIKLFLDRILPAKLYQELGLKTAGVSKHKGTGEKPSVVINVGVAGQDKQGNEKVVEGTVVVEGTDNGRHL